MSSPAKPHAPSCDRNQGVIRAVLLQHFAERRRVLEIGSGTGQHAVCFAAALPNALWQTSDVQENLPGIRLWLDEAALPNTPPPIELDVNGAWPKARYDAVFTANTLHIMGWPEVQNLFANLDGVLEPQATLAVYGPFNYGGQFTSDSNRQFELWLKQRSPVSGIRDFEAVDALASSIGLRLVADHAMPANNRTLVWERSISKPAATHASSPPSSGRTRV
jgi:cyclopropane fatty-acyl-phospholipid synthase-like methyltransferase